MEEDAIARASMEFQRPKARGRPKRTEDTDAKYRKMGFVRAQEADDQELIKKNETIRRQLQGQPSGMYHEETGMTLQGMRGTEHWETKRDASSSLSSLKSVIDEATKAASSFDIYI